MRAEALARCGVGELTLTDADVVSPSNLNRQLVALRSTVGRYKTEVMQERIADINPDCKVHIKTLYFDAKTAAEYDFSAFSYVADAIDSVADKVRLIASARAAGVPSSVAWARATNSAVLSARRLWKIRKCARSPVSCGGN